MKTLREGTKDKNIRPQHPKDHLWLTTSQKYTLPQDTAGGSIKVTNPWRMVTGNNVSFIVLDVLVNETRKETDRSSNYVLEKRTPRYPVHR